MAFGNYADKQRNGAWDGPPLGANPKLAWRNGCVRLSWMNCELVGTPAVSRRQQAAVVSTNTQRLVWFTLEFLLFPFITSDLWLNLTRVYHRGEKEAFLSVCLKSEKVLKKKKTFKRLLQWWDFLKCISMVSEQDYSAPDWWNTVLQQKLHNVIIAKYHGLLLHRLQLKGHDGGFSDTSWSELVPHLVFILITV